MMKTCPSCRRRIRSRGSDERIVYHRYRKGDPGPVRKWCPGSPGFVARNAKPKPAVVDNTVI